VSDDARSNQVFEIEPAESGGLLGRLPWWLILSVAFVVTELTTHPSIGVSVLCLKFGWNDFRTAFWLRCRDPNRKRGATCGWFYLASGLWRVCLWSFGLMFVTIIFFVETQRLQPVPPKAQNEPNLPPEIQTCMVMWLASFASAMLFTGAAILLAWRRRVKVWISASISESRRRDAWPPRPLPRMRPEANLLKYWAFGTGIGAFVVFFVIGLFLIDPFMGFDRAGNNGPLAPVFGLVVVVGFPLLAVIFCPTMTGLVLQWFGARSPLECWPPEPHGEHGDSSD
jgi:hypothetical protein